ncbi:MAG TPA: pro-sigmaK processing inhibitor BofA [Syntrophothermus lipocalidus]|uniref:Pro-sigmaK processing inhibitor BofA n=1 Tax=Syntrophothermus lipocalidus (strain DSM 12680 / TGB-C1) TaxID=643648 RepID=D7CII0_SYNLT|nr:MULTISPECIES: pro-sigmaK processing inhibitor BofA family protein [Syntrophothermus]ADI00845.1 pro-sigmaK processing inhibitor BofA [Syntrophothermus lipocalidus DSM 12680]NSW83499.1 pro-sigmaK processing inhibitor BofA family protein [Syntrophothermus sp.]HHV76556.1 pro-sigmaK processing inhibitor BofA [Syntrophothermus lipocalidus]HOV42694.1 pro-sigmaK processing inhibitor BofA family protein [Syntrophothermus lipocalidus]
METVNIVMGAFFLAVILLILAQVLLQPIKLVWKLLLNSAIGLAMLMAFNYFGGYFDFSIPVNIITVLIAGFLGIPGLILLACFKLII